MVELFKQNIRTNIRQSSKGNQLELAPPQEQDTAEKHETENIETEQSIVGKQARSVCRL